MSDNTSNSNDTTIKDKKNNIDNTPSTQDTPPDNTDISNTEQEISLVEIAVSVEELATEVRGLVQTVVEIKKDVDTSLEKLPVENIDETSPMIKTIMEILRICYMLASAPTLLATIEVYSRVKAGTDDMMNATITALLTSICIAMGAPLLLNYAEFKNKGFDSADKLIVALLTIMLLVVIVSDIGVLAPLYTH